jgi:hypothetical protein
MFVDYDKMLQDLRKQSTEYFIKTIKEMLIFWFEESCIDVKLPFPVTFINLSFDRFNFNDDSLIFSSSPPRLINDYGILNDNTYSEIQKILLNELLTLSYVYCFQKDNTLHIHYEDLKGLMDYELEFKIEDNLVNIFKESTIEDPIRLKLLDNFISPLQ